MRLHRALLLSICFVVVAGGAWGQTAAEAYAELAFNWYNKRFVLASNGVRVSYWGQKDKKVLEINKDYWLYPKEYEIDKPQRVHTEKAKAAIESLYDVEMGEIYNAYWMEGEERSSAVIYYCIAHVTGIQKTEASKALGGLGINIERYEYTYTYYMSWMSIIDWTANLYREFQEALND